MHIFGANCADRRPDDASYSGGGKEGVNFDLLLGVLPSHDGAVPSSFIRRETSGFSSFTVYSEFQDSTDEIVDKIATWPGLTNNKQRYLYLA